MVDPSLLHKRDIKLLRKKIVGIVQSSPELVAAVESEDSQQVLNILHSGIDPNFRTVKKRVRYPLHIAVSIGNFEIVTTLLDYGATIDVPDSMGMTPLYYAVETNNLKLTEYLLLRGAFVEWKDIQSSTP